MKSKFKEYCCDHPTELPFPKLMIDSDSGMVVLFSKSGKGVAVVGDRFEVTGNYEKDWDMFCFEDFHGKVTLKQ